MRAYPAPWTTDPSIWPWRNLPSGAVLELLEEAKSRPLLGYQAQLEALAAATDARAQRSSILGAQASAPTGMISAAM